jgi:hypothetical protein
MSSKTLTVDAELEKLQRETFGYFLHETNPCNGLVIDKTAADWPASIAATGFHGFYYHFLDMQTGRRARQCELSTVDSAFLLAGALTAGIYFDADTADETEIRTLGDALYRRADWQWAQDQAATVTHGWKPESGFLDYRWEGYDEALLLYILGLGSPTHPLPERSYARATYVQQLYAIDNPLEFEGYGSHCWGITASEGPGPDTIKVNGIERRFFDYLARGVPYGPDDGTLAPWAVVASLPFAPEIVLPALDYCIHQAKLTEFNAYGFKASFNPSHPGNSGNPYGWWVSPWHFGLNQGPIILMIENHRSELLWQLMRKCRYVADGLRRAGFDGGWL